MQIHFFIASVLSGDWGATEFVFCFFFHSDFLPTALAPPNVTHDNEVRTNIHVGQ